MEQASAAKGGHPLTPPRLLSPPLPSTAVSKNESNHPPSSGSDQFVAFTYFTSHSFMGLGEELNKASHLIKCIMEALVKGAFVGPPLPSLLASTNPEVLLFFSLEVCGFLGMGLMPLKFKYSKWIKIHS